MRSSPFFGGFTFGSGSPQYGVGGTISPHQKIHFWVECFPFVCRFPGSSVNCGEKAGGSPQKVAKFVLAPNIGIRPDSPAIFYPVSGHIPDMLARYLAIWLRAGEGGQAGDN